MALNSIMANRLKELRKQYGYTQESLAEALGISHSDVQRWECGKKPLKEHWIVRIARVFRCHPGELLEPLPSDHQTEQERKAATLARHMGPTELAAWFSAGGAFTQRQPARSGRKQKIRA